MFSDVAEALQFNLPAARVPYSLEKLEITPPSGDALCLHDLDECLLVGVGGLDAEDDGFKVFEVVPHQPHQPHPGRRKIGDIAVEGEAMLPFRGPLRIFPRDGGLKLLPIVCAPEMFIPMHFLFNDAQPTGATHTPDLAKRRNGQVAYGGKEVQ